MLKELQITGFALIEKVELSFYSGFSVLTGETGAGKSIIIDALSLLLGARASMEMIRTGCDSAFVEGQFHPPATVGPLLDEWGIESIDDELIISRHIFRNGRNRCRINGKLVTVTQLTQLGQYLVDILGQLSHQNILDSEKHLEILDSFADLEHKSLIEQIAADYPKFQRIKKERIKLQTQERERLARIDLLRFQVQEIEEANITIGEEAKLESQRQVLANLERITSTAQQTYSLIQESFGDRPPLYDMLAQAISELDGLIKYDQELKPIIDLFGSSLVQLEEGSLDLRRYLDGCEGDPQALENIERRLNLLRGLKRKYGASEQDILEYCKKSKQELAYLEQSEDKIEHLGELENELLTKLKDLTEALSQKRRQCALLVEEKIEDQLAEVNMERTRFKIDISDTQLSSTGKDRVEFKLSPNLGEELKPLTKIASGGEMSRIMLALKNCLAEAEEIPTLIFDEVDSGIGGITAQKVAVKLQELSQEFQVFAVTHLPIVASRAQHHYFIEKQEIKGRTIVGVTSLDYQGRVTELIRMLGGKDNQKITTAHAKELLKQGNYQLVP